MAEKFQSRKYKKKAEFAEELILKNTGEKASEFIERKNWNISKELCIRVLSDQLTKEDRKDLSVLDNLDHLKDDRSNPEYALDLILGWMLEDLLSEMIDQETFHTSADKNREFLKNPKANSDLKIKLKTNSIPLEIVNDYSGFWKRHGEMSNLRDSKFQNLRAENALILGIDMKNKKFVLINADEADKKGKKYNKKINKEASIINLKDEKFYDIKDLDNVLNRSIKHY